MSVSCKATHVCGLNGVGAAGVVAFEGTAMRGKRREQVTVHVDPAVIVSLAKFMNALPAGTPIGHVVYHYNRGELFQCSSCAQHENETEPDNSHMAWPGDDETSR